MESRFRLITADAREALETLPDNSIQVTVTSPPYFNLRRYTNQLELEIGREKTVADYVNHLVETFDVLKAKTRDDGLLFLNLGDSYVHGELAGVPWRVALALSDRGWILRSDIIWKKPNAMPSSVKNRPTVDHEYVFMFAKSKSYYYDQDAIREPHVTFSPESKMRGGRNHFGKRGGTPEQGKNAGNSNLHDARWDQAFNPLGRNKRTVWEIPLGKFRGAHFAVFPEKLVEICVDAGSFANSLVCDPFSGSGTTGVVALRKGRQFFGCDINEEYNAMARARFEGIVPIDGDGLQPLS
ncbi:MAG: site-specific DNA-methyltransferase [Oscillibacter sp.]|nr:site-specific DNA-methyltransferase [Oscillibacter sp.]